MKTNLKQINRILKALANERRLRILNYLLEEKLATVSEISENINLSFKSTSGHLIILERVGLVDRQPRGPYVFYSPDKERKNLLNFILKTT